MKTEQKIKRPGIKAIVKNHNGQRYQLMTISIKKNKESYIDTIYCDWDLKGLDVFKLKGANESFSSFALTSRNHFKKIKKEIEQIHPNLLLVINNPEEYVGKISGRNHIFCNATIYIPMEKFDKKTTLQSWTDEVIEICEEARQIILNSIDK